MFSHYMGEFHSFRFSQWQEASASTTHPPPLPSPRKRQKTDPGSGSAAAAAASSSRAPAIPVLGENSKMLKLLRGLLDLEGAARQFSLSNAEDLLQQLSPFLKDSEPMVVGFSSATDEELDKMRKYLGPLKYTEDPKALDDLIQYGRKILPQSGSQGHHANVLMFASQKTEAGCRMRIDAVLVAALVEATHIFEETPEEILIPSNVTASDAFASTHLTAGDASAPAHLTAGDASAPAHLTVSEASAPTHHTHGFAIWPERYVKNLEPGEEDIVRFRGPLDYSILFITREMRNLLVDPTGPMDITALAWYCVFSLFEAKTGVTFAEAQCVTLLLKTKREVFAGGLTSGHLWMFFLAEHTGPGEGAGAIGTRNSRQLNWTHDEGLIMATIVQMITTPGTMPAVFNRDSDDIKGKGRANSH
ncbi:hypothetical protein B0H16DRAFT_1746251 [Mycena metata]|uniref:Uncharacterized protein n=1 Tax=Mycena metata TaxID=1033252 RepID=A0AAD7GZD4_9AGAR|nr:hypothetical protein B0H16DRAFT_1746251 [Mycena metata]